jgi:hypothetical protein
VRLRVLGSGLGVSVGLTAAGDDTEEGGDEKKRLRQRGRCAM